MKFNLTDYCKLVFSRKNWKLLCSSLAILLLGTALFIGLFAFGQDTTDLWTLKIIYIAVIGTAIAWIFGCLFLPLCNYELIVKMEWETKDAASLCGEIAKNRYIGSSAAELLQKIRRMTDREYASQILKEQMELGALQSKINPHFLYNTLEAIRGKAMIEHVEEIAEMSEVLAKIFRYSVGKDTDVATLEEELYHLDNYILIQQYRFNDKFIVKKSITSDEKVLTAEVPRMTLQPIIENAIFHGLETKPGKGTIDIEIDETDQHIIITIRDDGIGIEEGQLYALNQRLQHPDDTVSHAGKSGTGIALGNVNQRVKLLFGETYGLTIYSTYGMGTDVELLIPRKNRDGLSGEAS